MPYNTIGHIVVNIHCLYCKGLCCRGGGEGEVDHRYADVVWTEQGDLANVSNLRLGNEAFSQVFR